MGSLESLATDKFRPLTKAQALQIRGGAATGGGRKVIGAEKSRDDSGAAIIRYHWQSWGSDDIGGGQECFYKLTDFWGDWEMY